MMSDCGANSSYSPSRNKYSKYGTKVNVLRADLRRDFLQRMKDLRYNETNKFRRMLSNVGFRKKFETMIELKKLLCSEKDATFDADQVLEEINEIENELLHKELETQAEEYDLSDDVNHFLNKCIVCDQTTENNFCDKCAQQFFTDDFSNIQTN